jgi:hypothetical protein
MIILVSLGCSFCKITIKLKEVLKIFLRMTQNEFDAKVKKIRSENNIEFKNTQVEDFSDEEDIKHDFQPLILLNKMGWPKEKNHTLIDIIRIMFDEYKTSDQFCTETINTACHATNRLYLHNLLKKISYELLTGNKPNV